MIDCILADIAEIKEYLPTALAIAAIATLLFVSVYGIIKKRFSFSRTLVIYLLVTYGCLFVWETFLNREPGSRTDITLKLWGTLSSNHQAQAYFVENIILFMPMALLAIVVPKMRHWWVYFILGISLSTAIEAAQHLTGRGYLQTDDIVANTAGCMLGYLIFATILWLVRSLSARKKTRSPE